MPLRLASARASALLLGACGSGLLGCPQLLDDSFMLTTRVAPTRLDSHPDGGAGGAPSTGPDLPGPGPSGPDAGRPASVQQLGALLAHRYGFKEAGTLIVDSVGTADGTAIGVRVATGSDKVSLSGASGEYVDLPNGLLAGLESVTFEAWVNWTSSAYYAPAWQNIFDFGATAREGVQGVSKSRLYLTSKSDLSGHMRAGYTLTDYEHELHVDASRALPKSVDASKGTQVALVLDGPTGTLQVYIDGVQEASSAGLDVPLSSITDTNNWLGRSQYSEDPSFNGEILEFRIYGAALSREQLELSFRLGADAQF